MKDYSCEKCGSVDVFIDDRGSQKALMCGDCGSWLKWLGKKELHLVERYIKEKQSKDVFEKEIDVPLSVYELENMVVILRMCICANGIQNKDKLQELTDKLNLHIQKLK